MTHKDKVEKRNLELDWITPEDYEGTVIFKYVKMSYEKDSLIIYLIKKVNYDCTVIVTIFFYCSSTFLQDYATYWVGVESPRITVLRDSIQVMTTIPPPTTERTTTTPYYELDTQQSVGIIYPFILPLFHHIIHSNK